MKVLWSPEARQDLREIYLYLAADNPDAARALQKRIKQAVALLCENPQIGRPGRVPGTRELVVSGTSYIVPYRSGRSAWSFCGYITRRASGRNISIRGSPMHRWIHAEKARYYQALLVKDLFDEWILIEAWGALESKRGGMRSTPVPSYEVGLECIGAIDRQRKRRGYRSLVPA